MKRVALRAFGLVAALAIGAGVTVLHAAVQSRRRSAAAPAPPSAADRRATAALDDIDLNRLDSDWG